MFIYRRRIYTPDTDCGGVVYHAHYLRFMDEARTEWFAKLGFPLRKCAEQDLYFVIRTVTLRYLKGAVLDQCIQVQSTIIQIRKCALTFSQVITDTSALPDIFCQAQVEIVGVNHCKKPQVLPESLLQCLSGII